MAGRGLSAIQDPKQDISSLNSGRERGLTVRRGPRSPTRGAEAGGWGPGAGRTGQFRPRGPRGPGDWAGPVGPLHGPPPAVAISRAPLG